MPAPPAVKRRSKERISPGLDIQGGLRLMYEVEVDEAVRDRRDLRADQLQREVGAALGLIPKDETPTREQLKATCGAREGRDRGRAAHPLTFKNPADAPKLDHELITRYGDLREVQRDGGVRRCSRSATDFLDQIRDTAVEQARETIGNRIDALGLREAAVSVAGHQHRGRGAGRRRSGVPAHPRHHQQDRAPRVPDRR